MSSGLGALYILCLPFTRYHYITLEGALKILTSFVKTKSRNTHGGKRCTQAHIDSFRDLVLSMRKIAGFPSSLDLMPEDASDIAPKAVVRDNEVARESPSEQDEVVIEFRASAGTRNRVRQPKNWPDELGRAYSNTINGHNIQGVDSRISLFTRDNQNNPVEIRAVDDIPKGTILGILAGEHVAEVRGDPQDHLWFHESLIYDLSKHTNEMGCITQCEEVGVEPNVRFGYAR